MPEILEGRYLTRVGAAMALAIGAAAMSADINTVEEEKISKVDIEAQSYAMPIPVEMKLIETTTTSPPESTTTTIETTTTSTTVAPTTTTTEYVPPPPPPEQYPIGCENYESMVAQYDWPLAGAMRTMAEESGCNPNAVSATDDHGLFQLHGQRVYDPAENIRIAYGMYVNARRGSRNFSAWYAVCTPDQQPKYPEVNCS